ncbi:hypothetical protein GCM10010289_62580 [Streptomyces violascens]|uniref:Uncharacterized protein n=1 Tax=Streptomyces violascens TaxID=67381 RepID=A0ABQ3QSF3_9ACTN|nr:hypothetical protein GCM10010289_62580 [Streptomyces violascens]GHI40199.1 hypothetical protein Sviol_46070 [Streptomyces violascens]
MSAGLPQEQDADGLGVQRALPQTAPLGDRHGVAAVVTVHCGRVPGQLGGEVGGGAQAVALQTGPAAASGPGRRETVEDGTLAQAGGERDVRREVLQGLAVVGASATTCSVRCEWQDDSVRTVAAASSTLGFPVPGRQSRAITGRHTGRDRKGRPTSRPRTTKQVPRPTGRGPRAAPSCCQNAPNTFFPDHLSRGVVHRRDQRRVLGQQQAGNLVGEYEIGVGAAPVTPKLCTPRRRRAMCLQHGCAGSELRVLCAVAMRR